MPDPDSPQYANLFRDNLSPEFLEYIRKNKDRHLRDADPSTYDRMVEESDALAQAMRDVA